MSNNNIIRLISSMHCSCCNKRLDDKCITFQGQHGELTIIKISCKNCGKNFAIAFMGLISDELDISLQQNDETYACSNEPINYDDVLNAHEFIQNIDENWRRFIDKRKDTNFI